MNGMTATDNSWAATDAKLNATYALHIQETGRQPRAPVSELGLLLISKASDPRSDRVNGSARDVRFGSSLCENAMFLGRQARHGDAGPGSGADRLHQTTNAQNADYPFHVVGQDV